METMIGGRHQQQHNPSSTANGGYTSGADLEGPYAGEPPAATAEWRRSGGTSLTTGRAAARACCGHGAGKEAEWVGKGGGRVRVDPGLGAPDSDAGPRICRRQHPPARTTSGAAAPQGWPQRREPAKKRPAVACPSGGPSFSPGDDPALGDGRGVGLRRGVGAAAKVGVHRVASWETAPTDTSAPAVLMYACCSL
jgi:hypothetical protein